jgi:outer membrane receptor for ferrienterochelin and colicin
VVALEPAPIAVGNAGDDLRAVQQDTGSRKRNNTWLVGPIVVGGLGLVLAGVTTVRLATRLDSCVNPDEKSFCTYRRRVNVAPTAIEYTLSAALIGGSIAWMVIGLSGDDDERQPGVSARLGPTGIQLAGRF